MAAVDDKIAATGFSAPTALPWEQVLAAADEAAHKAAGAVDRFSRDEPSGTVVRYRLKRAGLKVNGECTVKLSSVDGEVTVTFAPGNYVKTRPTVAGFIPVGPWNSVALKPLERFSTTLRRSLS